LSQIKAFASFAVLGEAAATLIAAITLRAMIQSSIGGEGENRPYFVIITTNIMKEVSFELFAYSWFSSCISFLLHLLLIQNAVQCNCIGEEQGGGMDLLKLCTHAQCTHVY